MLVGSLKRAFGPEPYASPAVRGKPATVVTVPLLIAIRRIKWFPESATNRLTPSPHRPVIRLNRASVGPPSAYPDVTASPAIVTTAPVEVLILRMLLPSAT